MSTSNRSSKKIREKKKDRRNTQMHIVMYLFLLLFLCMMGNFAYYIQFNSTEDVNNSYNTRQEKLEIKVLRGKILADDGQVLAETMVGKDGSETRHYPFGELFAHVVGYSTKGRYGVERSANINLLTSNAYIGERISNDIANEKNIGDNAVTTLNVKLQQTASDVLGVYKGAIVVMEPDTGKILAMVSNPGFDPNTIVSEWDELNAETATSPLLNRATSGLYPPGSTFKIVTLLEYIRENEEPEDYSFNCSGRFTYDGVTINCYHGSNHGNEGLKKSFAKSCNSSFANIGSTLNYNKFNKTADELLFNKDLPVRFNYRSSGFSCSDSNDTEEKLHTAIGQGKTLVSPLHMAMITSAVANNGVMQKPYLIDRIENYQGAVIKQYKPDSYKQVMTEDESAFLKEYMTAVVEEGTGSKLSGLTYTVAGKTGSAEYNDQKGDSHSWFTGFSNVDDPDIVVTIIVEGAGSGSDYAVPMAKRIFDAYYQ